MKNIITLFLFVLPVVAMAQTTNDSTVYMGVEQQPEFQGGYDSLSNFIRTNLKYPRQAEKENITGQVIVGFIVEKDGSISNVCVKSKPIKYLDDEAIRVVKLMPNFKPGMQAGKPVRVSYVVPIKFKLR